MIQNIRKRDGRIENFDKSKITNAILKAMNHVFVNDINCAEQIADSIIKLNKDVADVNAIDKKAEKVEKYVVISVNPGNGSELISRKLYDAGLIESAIMFNRFLVSNEYDKILRSGDHEIPVGATEEEMARILCGLE